MEKYYPHPVTVIYFTDYLRVTALPHDMSMEFDWSPDLTVFDETLDNQHRQLLCQVNRLIQSITEDTPKTPVVQEAIAFLDEYTLNHFRAEEEYMKAHNYPYLDAHIALHTKFIEQYTAIKERILKDNMPILSPVELELQLSRWWIDHIGGADKEYAMYIKTHAE